MTDIKLIGITEFKANLEKMKRSVRKEILRALETTVSKIEEQTRENAPVKSGHLKANYFYEVNKNKLEGIVWTNTEYAPYVEFGTFSDEIGTVRQAAQPHFQPAVINNIGYFGGVIERAFKEGIIKS